MKCPACGQYVQGFMLPSIKLDIFEAIKAAREIGITSHELIMKVYYETGRKIPKRSETIRCHIFQINEILEETDFRIFSERSGRQAFWVLGKRKKGKGEGKWDKR